MGELRHETLRRGGRVVLRPALLPLPPRGTIGIVGVNGAGKTTLFHALARALPDGAGRATLKPLTDSPGLAWAPQQPAFPGWLDVACVAWLYGFEFDELCRRFPDMLLEELRGRRAAALSVGQAQALAVVLALALDAPLTILDEPFAALDFRRRSALTALLHRRRSGDGKGVTLLSSQSAADLLDTCDWIVVMRAGEYVFSGGTECLVAGTSTDAEARQRFEQALIGLLAAASTTQG